MSTRQKMWTVMSVVLCVFCASCPARAGRVKTANRAGLMEDCSTTEGWIEWDKDGNEIPPRVKMESKEGLLYIHTNRGLLSKKLAEKYKWLPKGVFRGSILRKNYGKINLDKYHYFVVRVKGKGSGVFFGVNGFDTKAGYTTGLTAVDLKDYDDKRLHGRQNVRLELDLHDNLTTLVVEELKLVSELTEEEKESLIGRGHTIRDEKLKFQDYHGLYELKRRAKTPPPNLEGEEMAIFRDTATGAITTRLTADGGDDYLPEGGIWSSDGAAIKFGSRRKLPGIPILLLSEGKVISGPRAHWKFWSPSEATVIFTMARQGKTFTVSSWNYATKKTEKIAEFTTPQIGGYTGFKRITKKGKLIVEFRETPHLFIVDTGKKTARHIELSTRVKGGSLSADEKFVSWANCYTYEGRWRNLETGEEGICSRYTVGHGAGAVGTFGGYLRILLSGVDRKSRTPGDKIKIWANWQNSVPTDYGSYTSDGKYVFTNGIGGDVKRQHLMIPSDDTGAVLRVARYFTKFSWTSPTYSRPSPDYTKLIYNDNCRGAAQLLMVYTRRTDPPEDVKLEGKKLAWTVPKRSKEIKGYNIYASKKSGSDFVKINDKPVTGTSYNLKNAADFYAVTSVEHSHLESMFSAEVSAQKERTLYFEAERQQLSPPARRFFDGDCNDFQCVRINAETPEEKAREGVITIDTKNAPAGTYSVWGLVKGRGKWVTAGKAARISSKSWKWVKLADAFRVAADSEIVRMRKLNLKILDIYSRNDSLKLDTVMITTEDFIPGSPDPRDSTPPAPVKTIVAKPDKAKGEVILAWTPVSDPDFHHYSVYCGTDRNFKCGNATLVRSVRKASITDAGMERGVPLFYKIVAYDSRMNASAPAVIEVEAIAPEPSGDHIRAILR